MEQEPFEHFSTPHFCSPKSKILITSFENPSLVSHAASSKASSLVDVPTTKPQKYLHVYNYFNVNSRQGQ